ncbi:MAG: YdeI/OmpD-associated family protein [Archangium sp.]
MKHRAFKTREDLELWLSKNHASETELYVRIYKKNSGTKSVTWNDVVLAVLCWGWIDGVKNSLDEVSFLQRITPRRPKSVWSKINRGHVERLIKEGRMQPQGLAHVDAAKADGRWDAAYAGSAEMVIPDDFLAALEKNRAAAKFYPTLKKASLYRIAWRLQNAKKPETRVKRIAKFIDELSRGEQPS